MSGPTRSYLSVQYELRPAKQVERHMLVDALQLLAAGGFPIRDYQYTGMGSAYFVDFALFHRALGIRRMLSVEHAGEIARRVEFNKPYGCVETQIGAIGDFIPRLDPDVGHVLWLDYDAIVDEGRLQDVALAATCLPGGSVLLVTLDTEPPAAPTASGEGEVGGASREGPHQWRDYYLSEAGPYLPPDPPVADFARSKLPLMTAQAVLGAIAAGMAGRADLDFIQLFYFVYRDGHRMMTAGGMLGDRRDRQRIRQSGLLGTSYCRRDLREWYEIKVPRISRKERFHLDSNMPNPDGWLPDPQDFELSREDVDAYREIYRFYPNYAELLL